MLFRSGQNKSTIGRRPSQILIVTESIFSMDGDAAPLREIVVLKEKYGAWLMVDEAHATGLYGPNRRGLADELGVSNRIEIQMGTLGKALGASGGFICGSRSLVDFLINRARSFIFSERGDLIIAKLSPEKYEELSRAHLLEPDNRDPGRPVVWSHPAFANKSIYARNDQEIVCVSLAE